MTPTPRVLPQTDADTEGFFEFATRGQLAAYRCDGCGRLSFPRQYLCPACRSLEGAWTSLEPHGRLHTWTVVTHQVNPAFDVPYVVILVEHRDHPDLHFVGRIEGEPDLVMGQELEAGFLDLGDGAVVVTWRPAH